ncbi:hypothetical protein SAMN06295967_101263 [Belliella buryatensis]|uniref:Uncharacterized protein n=1 Tax=Belliella buryatensis TaxID=1500549 RepID=A0A239AM97_9BACT|nr:hypothetical protein SAMN06295967_101263 [Belliella buryatensis]
MIIRNDTSNSIKRKDQADNRQRTTVDSRQHLNLRCVRNKIWLLVRKRIYLKANFKRIKFFHSTHFHFHLSSQKIVVCPNTINKLKTSQLKTNNDYPLDHL